MEETEGYDLSSVEKAGQTATTKSMDVTEEVESDEGTSDEILLKVLDYITRRYQLLGRIYE